MLLTILTLGLFSSVLSSGKEEVVLDALRSQTTFTNLLNVHLTGLHKHYSKPELRARARYFRKALEQVADCNKHAHFHCNLNQFSTMTAQEKQQYLGLANVTGVPPPHAQPPRLSSGPTVTAKDWRDLNAVAAVKNQGSCGSCWAFAATAAVEGAYSITAGKLRTFSEQELLECTYERFQYNGCGGGWYYDAFDYLMRNKHFSSEKTLPYEGVDGACRNGYANAMVAAEVTGYVKANKDDYSVAAAIEMSPVSVAMLAAGNFFSYSDGLYDGYYDCSGGTFPNHALTAVAFTENSFVIKNSWGKTWGDGGYINIARGRNVCFVNDWVYSPTMKKTGDDDTDPDPSPTEAPKPDPDPKPEPDDECKEQEYDENCADLNTRDCENIYYERRCHVDYMMSYTLQYCAWTCGFCNNIPLRDLEGDCAQRIADNSCGDSYTKLICPKSCCDKKDGGDDEKEDDDNDGCAAGLTRCPDGSCRHVHMC